jgi:gamma-glutamyltranspeptidase/glutathione hydrolase
MPKSSEPGGETVEYAFPYRSQRMPVMARNVVATSQPLAAQAGIRMLDRGGNAVDAAIAAAIALTVVEPTSNGIGGDAFALLWDGDGLVGLNGSGRSPRGLDAARFQAMDAMPLRGWDSVTVPGAVASWVTLSERYSALPFETLFEPAISYAEHGFAVSPITARAWSHAAEAFAAFPEFADAFLPGGRSPRAGELFRFPDQAKTLRLIAESRGEAFYRGSLATAMASHAERAGAPLREADLAAHVSEWVDPIGMDFAGATLHQIPPNGQGLIALLALGILRHTDIAAFDPDGADAIHLQVEALKLAIVDAERYVSDARTMDVGVDALLDDAYLAERASRIDPGRAGTPEHGVPARGGTVYVCTADASGRMVSFIQSNYYGFGSGIVVPGTGISLQNRGAGFSTRRGHPNVVAADKKPFHTIIPGFVTQAGAPRLAFGVMGGPMQPQGHVQMMVRVFLHGQNVQAAVDAPRWRVLEGLRVAIEHGFSDDTVAELGRRGHVLEPVAPDRSFAFGGAQLTLATDAGYVGASDPRKDGQAVGF